METNPNYTKSPDAMETSRARELMKAYASSHDPRFLTDDAVFRDMSTGQEHHGREAIAGMLDYVYHQAFDAHAETEQILVDGDHAVLEATFVGRHIGEFAGIPATGRSVRVPLLVSYDLADDGVKRARIYMAVPEMMRQLGAGVGEEA